MLHLPPMKRLLLLSCDSEVEDAVDRMLPRMGIEIDAIRDADDALRRLNTSAYDVVVFDRVSASSHVTPLLDALRVQATPKPIVIVTSADDPDLDPNVVSLIVPSTYDTSALVGVILACATEPATIQPPEPDPPSIRVE